MQTKCNNNLLSIAAVAIILAAISLAQAIVVPLLLSLFISIIASVPVAWLRKRGLPPVLAVVIVAVLIIGLLLSTLLLLVVSLENFTQTFPTYADRIHGYTEKIVQLSSRLGVTLPETGLPGIIQPNMLLHLINSLLGSLTQLFSNFFLIVLMVVFMLLEASSFSDKLELIRDDAGKSLERVARFINDIKLYMAIKTVINLVTGVLVFAGLSFIGIENAVLWGVLFFLLNYIPTIGSVIAAVPVVIMALLQLGIGSALIVTGYILIIKMLIGNIIEPRITGRGVGLSTLVVFLSMLFWGWLLGPAGMLLSVPLTMWVKSFTGAREHMRWLSILISSHDQPQYALNKPDKEN